MQVKKRRGLKIGLIILTTIVALIIALPIIFKSYIKNNLVEIYNRSQNDFVLAVGDINITGFNSGMILTDVELINSDTTSDIPLSSLKAQSISISNVSVFKLIFKKNLEAGKLEINSPYLMMNRVKEKRGDEKKKKSEEKNSVNISEIKITDPHFAYFTNRSDSLPLFKSDKGLISIREFSVDTVKDSKAFSAYDIDARLQGIKYLTKDSLYAIQVSMLHVSFAKRSLQIDSFQVIPSYSKKEFGHRAGKQTDRLSLIIPLITSSTFDAKSFVERQMVVADSMEIKSFALNAYRDKNIHEIVEYPEPLQVRIKGIDIPVSVKHLNVLDGDVLYEELNGGSIKAGHISFNHIASQIENISNLHPEDTLTVTAKALFGNKASLEVKLEFPMEENDNSFLCNGELNSFPASTLNTMLPYVAGVKADDGYINYVKFNFHATKKSSTGTVAMNYKDLKVAVVDIVDGKTQNTGKKIVSLLANAFIVK
ncbi:MAG: hypothetical protein KA444_10775, partial [Bacteroidia bacterium]|nr:hypothetical protein [Bacteroidia bacterium]